MNLVARWNLNVPTNIRGTSTERSVTIMWNPIAEANRFEVNFNGNIFSTNTASRTFTGLSPNTIHNFSVRAISNNNTSPFSPTRRIRTRRRRIAGNSSASNSSRPFSGRERFRAIDPVDAISGAFYWDYTFLSIETKDIMDFNLHYNSASEYNGILGKKWSHSYNYMLEIYDGQAYFTHPNGEAASFTYDEEQEIFVPDYEQYDYELLKTSSGYVVKSVYGTEYIFDNHLALESIRLNNTLDTAFVKNEQNQITQIISKYGSSFSLGYNGDKLVRVTDPLGNTVQFEYDNNDNLTSAVNPEEDTIHFSKKLSKV